MPRRSNETKTSQPRKTSRARPLHSVPPAKAPLQRVQPDAVSLLRADHRALRHILTDLKGAATASQRKRLLSEVQRQLKAHTTIEEEIFYPAFRAAGLTKKDQQRFHEATAEHHAADVILSELASTDAATEAFPGRAKVLKEIVEHHAEEEEIDMFPRVRELIAAAELRTLGKQMDERRRALLRESRRSGSKLQRVADFVSASFSRA